MPEGRQGVVLLALQHAIAIAGAFAVADQPHFSGGQTCRLIGKGAVHAG